MLGSSRDEIINYLKTLGQDYVTDSTNLENDYARNKIRNVMLPEISRLFPSAMAGIELTLDNLQGDYAVWSGAVEAFKRDAVEACGHGQIKINRRKLAASADPATLLNALLSRYGFNGEQTKAIASASRVGAVFESKEYVAEVGRNDISVFSPGSFNNAETYALTVDVNAPKADLLLCDGAGLEEPGGPEPLVDAHSVQISLPNEKKGPTAATIEPLSKQCSLRNYSSDLTSSTATAFSVSSM